MHLAVPKYAARRLHPAGRTRPGPALVLVQFIYVLAVQNILQVLAVLVFLVYLIGGQNLFAADPAVQIGDLLQAGNLSVLVGFYGLYETHGFPCQAR